jgi:hypothetical protein
MVPQISLILLKHELSVGCWWGAESGNGVFLEIGEETSSAEGRAIVMNEEAGTTIPGSEERPSSFGPS